MSLYRNERHVLDKEDGLNHEIIRAYEAEFLCNLTQINTLHTINGALITVQRL